MCWKSKNKPIIYVAKKDIPICKVCRISESKNIYSYYYRQPYKLNVRYQKDEPLNVKFYDYGISDASNNFYYVCEGFHSYDRSCYIKRSSNEYLLKNKHDDTLDYYITGTIVIVNGYIPKGANYYVNSNDEYVSDALILIDYEDIIKIPYEK